VPAREELRVDQRAHERRADASEPARDEALLDRGRHVSRGRCVEAGLADERVDDPRLGPRTHRTAGLAADEGQRADGPLVPLVVLDDDPLARRATAVAVEDEGLRGPAVPRVDEHPLDRVLDVGDAGNAPRMAALEIEADDAGELLGEEPVVAPHRA